MSIYIYIIYIYIYILYVYIYTYDHMILYDSNCTIIIYHMFNCTIYSIIYYHMFFNRTVVNKYIYIYYNNTIYIYTDTVYLYIYIYYIYIYMCVCSVRWLVVVGVSSFLSERNRSRILRGRVRAIYRAPFHPWIYLVTGTEIL